MAITRTLKVIGKTRKQSLLDNLNRKLKRSNSSEIITNREITRKYKQYRTTSQRIILQTQKMLERFSKEPKLKDAQFVFLDRDALPYMHISRELCQQYGLKREQFKPAIITKKAEEQIGSILDKIYKHKGTIISISSNGEEIRQIARKIERTREIKNLKKIISEEIDLTKPVVVIDSGYQGTAVKKYQILLKAINPDIQTYSSMFFTNYFASLNTEYVILDKNDHLGSIKEIENAPKFTGKLLKTEERKNTITFKRQKESSPDINLIGGYPEQANAEIFMIALRNQLARYKKEKGIN
jgi:hypothetical protein